MTRYHRVLEIKHQLQGLYDGDVVSLRDSFEEPVWIGPDEIMAHARYWDGWLVDPYRVNLRTGRAGRAHLAPRDQRQPPTTLVAFI